MFGYVHLDSKAPLDLKNYFGQSYCMLCRSIEHYYGRASRFFLSYDVTFLSLYFLSTCEHPENRIPCYLLPKKVHECIHQKNVQKCAALNLALTYVKLQDQIRDEHSFKAKFLLLLYKKSFKKAHTDFPTMWEQLEKGYSQFYLMENENKSLEDLEEAMASLICSIAKEEFDIQDENALKELSYASKWVYFIDACDDLDKDLKKGTFNPLKSFGSKREFTLKNPQWIYMHFQEIKGDLTFVEGQTLALKTARRILYYGLPETASKIFKKELFS